MKARGESGGQEGPRDDRIESPRHALENFFILDSAMDRLHALQAEHPDDMFLEVDFLTDCIDQSYFERGMNDF